jgi:lipopolysaccharide heptosyltransferase I
LTPLSFPSPPERILIIKPSAIGDIVHALPVLNLVRKKWPAAKISWLVTTSCAGLLDGHPQLDEVILFNRKRFAHTWRSPTAALALWKFARGLRSRKFDLVIDLQGLLRSGWLSWEAQAPVRIGPNHAREFGWIFYTDRVPVSWEWHAVERYLAIATALGCGSEPVEFHFAINDEDRASVAAMIPDGKRFAVLLPGTNWPTKNWPIEHFAACVDPLKSRFGLDTVIAGGPGDAALAAQIAGLNLCGKTSLRQLVALLERADLVIANDSGPMHIAAALGKPLVSPYGPTNPDRTGPFRRMDAVIRVDIPCSPCYSRKCSHQSCLKWLSVESVMAHAAEQLTGGSALADGIYRPGFALPIIENFVR